MSRSRKPDHVLWEKVKQTVKPMSSNRAELNLELDKALLNETEKPKASPAPRQLVRAALPEPAVTISLSPMSKVLDPSISRKIAKGRISIDGKIDLHGMTQVEAHQRLWRFIENAYLSGKRTVLVITGKGLRSEGVLRRSVPQWLENPEFQSMVIGSETAHISHGGSGALYVRIRKNRNGLHQ